MSGLTGEGLAQLFDPVAGEAGLGLAVSGGAAGAALRRAFQSWETLFDRLPVGVCVCDRRGTIVHYNSRAAEMWEEEPPPCGCASPTATTFHADGAPMSVEQSPVAEALATGMPVKDREVVIARADGFDTDALTVKVDPATLRLTVHERGGRLVMADNADPVMRLALTSDTMPLEDMTVLVEDQIARYAGRRDRRRRRPRSSATGKRYSASTSTRRSLQAVV